MIRAIAVSVALSCLAAPASAQPASPASVAAKKPTPPAEGGPCIGVIPVVGNRFGVQNVGITIFSAEYTAVAIDAWGLDDLVVARVRAAASQRVAVRRIPFPKEAFIRPDRPLFHDWNAELANTIRRIAASSPKCQRYVVVTNRTVPFSTTGLRLRGMGILRHSFVSLSRHYVFAMTYIRIYDGRTFEVVKQGAGWTEGKEITLEKVLRTNPVVGPNRQFDESLWPVSPNDVAKNSTIKNYARELLAQSLDKRLPELLAD